MLTERENLRTTLSNRVPRWQPRGMAMICFSTAAVMLYTSVFPVEEDVELQVQLGVAGLGIFAGLFNWILAPYYRVWSMHTVILIGFSFGFLGLGQQNTSLGAAFVLVTLLWTGVLVGVCFRPQVVRVYEAGLCIGIAVAMSVNGVDGNAAVGLVFAGTFIVIMEILSRTTSQLRREATTDPLTGLLNRTGLERETSRVRSFSRDEGIAVLMVDLDGFKEINDSQGHQAGDEVLREFATAWREGARSGDLIARVGGDEFVIVFPAADENAAKNTVERLRQVSPSPWSGGLVLATPDESLESCLARADRLLYEEKAAKLAAEGASLTGGPPAAISSP